MYTPPLISTIVVVLDLSRPWTVLDFINSELKTYAENIKQLIQLMPVDDQENLKIDRQKVTLLKEQFLRIVF